MQRIARHEPAIQIRHCPRSPQQLSLSRQLCRVNAHTVEQLFLKTRLCKFLSFQGRFSGDSHA